MKALKASGFWCALAATSLAASLHVEVNNLCITEVNPDTGQAEVTRIGATQFTTTSSLPFCHRFNYFTAIPANTTFGPGESKVFVVAGLNTTDSDIWLYRDSNFFFASPIITGMKSGPAANVGAPHWPRPSGFGRARAPSCLHRLPGNHCNP